MVFSDEELLYSFDNINWEVYNKPVRISCTQDKTIYVKAVDDAGNETSGSSVVMKANIGVYTITKDDLKNGDFMSPSGFIRTFNTNTEEWFFAFNANIQSECNDKALKFTDFNGDSSYYFADSNEHYYYSVYGEKITKEPGTLTICNTSVPYSYIVDFDNAEIYFNASGKICAVIDVLQNVCYNWNSSSLVISDNHSRTYTIAFSNGEPTSITDCAGHTVTYVWTNGKLVFAVNALYNVEGCSYYNNRLTKCGDDTISYTSDGRVAQITHQNESFLKYTYNDNATDQDETFLGQVQISDGRGVSVFCHYADGFTVGEDISVYSDGAVYAGTASAVTLQTSDCTGYLDFEEIESEQTLFSSVMTVTMK